MPEKSGLGIFFNKSRQSGELITSLALLSLLIITAGILFGSSALNTVQKFLGRAAAPELPIIKKILPLSGNVGSIGNLTLSSVIHNTSDPTIFTFSGYFDRNPNFRNWAEVYIMGEPRTGISPNTNIVNPSGYAIWPRRDFNQGVEVSNNRFPFTGSIQTTSNWNCETDNKVVLILQAYNLASHGAFHSTNPPRGYQQIPYGQETPIDILINLKDFCGEPTPTPTPTIPGFSGEISPTLPPVSPTIEGPSPTPGCVEAPDFGMVGRGTEICPTKTPTPTLIPSVPPPTEPPQACIFQTENFVKERRKISQTDYEYLPLTAFDEDPNETDPKKLPQKYGSANDRWRIKTGIQDKPRPKSQFQGGRHEINEEYLFPNKDGYIEGDTACVKPYYDTSKYKVVEKQCDPRDSTLPCPGNLNPPPQDQRLKDRTDAANVTIGPDEACNLPTGCGGKYSYGWVLEGKCSFNAIAQIFDQQCRPITDPRFNQTPPKGTNINPETFISIGTGIDKFMEWIVDGHRPFGTYNGQNIYLTTGPRPGSSFSGGNYIVSTPNLKSKYGKDPATGNYHYYCCAFPADDPQNSYILGDHPDQALPKDFGDLASNTLFLGNRYPVGDPKNLWSEWEVVRQECVGFGCPSQLTPTRRKSTEGAEQDTIQGLRIACGTNVKYGWMLKKKNEPLRDPLPEKCLNFPTPTPTGIPPTPTAEPTIVVDPCQNGATPGLPCPTQTPTPTPPVACQGKFKATNYVKDAKTGQNIPNQMIGEFLRQYEKDGQPVDLLNSKQQFDVESRGRVELENLAETFNTDARIVYNSAADGWTIVRKECTDKGTKKGCPDDNTLQSSPMDKIRDLKVDCGVDVDYGWVLIKNSEISPTPPSVTPTPTTPEGGVNLNLKIRFQGITKEQITNNNLTVKNMTVRVGLGDGTLEAPVYQSVEFTAGDDGIWSGRATFTGVNPGSGYKILIKGPKHLQRRVCDPTPREDIVGPPLRRYVCDRGKLTINEEDNSFDFSNILQLAGDAPLPEIEGELLESGQDGVVNSFDAIAVISVLGQADPESLARVDFDLDGEVNGLDFGLLQRTLSVQSDEL